MKNTRKVMIICMAILMLITTCIVSGCNNNNNLSTNIIASHVKFGEFGYNGRYLTSYATKAITSQKAKEIATIDKTKTQSTVNSNDTIDNKSEDTIYLSVNELASSVSTSTIPSEYTNRILNKYSGCQIKTIYCVEGTIEEQSKTDMLYGVDFKSVIESNEFVPFSQLVAKYIIAYPELIDDMEQANTDFKNSEASIVAPFLNIFSYHTNETGNLIVQTRDFTQIASSIGGGIGSCYRQDTEILYDAEGKMSKWQTSLGLYSATPNGTMKQGYILEVEILWIQKV